MSTELLHKPSRTTALLSSYVGKTKSCSRLKYVLEQHLRTKLSRHPQSHLLPIIFPVGTCRRRAGPAPAPVGDVPVVAPSSPQPWQAGEVWQIPGPEHGGMRAAAHPQLRPVRVTPPKATILPHPPGNSSFFLIILCTLNMYDLNSFGGQIISAIAGMQIPLGSTGVLPHI